jgi:putative ABC transport system substrate-binding protein
MEAPDPQAPYLVAFRDGLRALGWTEGRQHTVDTWWGDGSQDRLRQQFPALIASQPDLVVASFAAVRPLLDVPLAAPMVFAFSGDVVQAGIVKSWARPGVPRTGVSYFSLDLVPKRLAMMKEMLPRLQRLAIVGWPPHPGELLELEAARDTADRMGLASRYYGVHTAAELELAFDAIARWRADGLFVFGGTVALNFAERIADFANRQRMPAVSAWASFAERGNVMTYGPVLQDSLTRLATIADRILRGAKAADMPVELPTRIELVLNAAAARGLGIDIPRPLLVRADRVIG